MNVIVVDGDNNKSFEFSGRATGTSCTRDVNWAAKKPGPLYVSLVAELPTSTSVPLSSKNPEKSVPHSPPLATREDS